LNHHKYNTKTTLIVPAAGKSSRYPGMRPKWLLTHPNGKLMIDEVVSSFNPQEFDRVIITILKDHCDQYDADQVLKQVFGDAIEILILPEPTKSAAETVYRTLEDMSVTGQVVIKDSDCLVESRLCFGNNYIVGLKVSSDSSVERIQQKSFIIKNDDDIVVDIIEKEIVSNIVCVGVYSMNANDYRRAYNSILENNVYKKLNELYVSHIVSYLVVCQGTVFEYVEADKFKDWGTKEDWYKELEKHNTYIFDIDGVMLRNCGKFGKKNWSNYFEPIQENINVVKRLSDEGHEIIFMTARTSEYLNRFRDLMEEVGIRYKQIVSGCNHGRRIIINDFAATNPYPSCEALSIKRNDELDTYLK
jgi:hypothetical protein